MTIDSLREFGANIDEGLERCMGLLSSLQAIHATARQQLYSAII